MTYQLFEPLKAWEYEALKQDIRRRGVLVPIEFDEHGEVIDGHNRLAICEELGITEYPRVTRRFTSDDEKKLHVIVLNAYRRQLAPLKRTTWLAIANQLRLDLGYPDEPVIVPSKAKKPSASDEPDAIAARQRDHRLQERMRPKMVLPSNADPWLVADEALDCLDRIRPYLVQLRVPLADLEIAMERIKQLAWGPQGASWGEETA